VIARTLRLFPRAGVVLLSGWLAAMAAPRSQAQQPEPSGSKAGPAAPAPPRAGDVIRRHVEAIGGRGAVLKLHSRYVWARFELPARRLSGTLQIYAERPNKRLVKMEYPDLGTRVIGFDGDNGWVAEPGGKPVLVHGKELAQLRDESLFDFDLHEDKDFKSIETAERTGFEGRQCYKLRLVSASLRESVEFYDTATGLFAGSIRRRETEKGPVTVKTAVSKYKVFDGVRLPTKITLRYAGTEEVITVMSVKHNRVDPSVFELPSRLRSRHPGSPADAQ
jgi:hypothetical protein